MRRWPVPVYDLRIGETDAPEPAGRWDDHADNRGVAAKAGFDSL